MSYRTLILAALAAAGPSALAFSDEPTEAGPSDAKALFAQLDANKDGRLSKDEVPDDRQSLFDRLVRIADRDDDGQLSSQEFAAGLAPDAAETPAAPERPDRATSDRASNRPGGGRFFERLDANEDGKIELDEVPEPGRERFEKVIARLDKDGDGAVTRREFAAAARRRGNADPRKPAARGSQPPGRPDGKRLFKRIDRNADGKLMAGEVPEERRPMFERLIERGDKDGDGGLSLEEFTAVFGRRRPATAPVESGAKPKAAAKRKQAAQAGAGREMPPGLFAALDADGDGQLDTAEIAAAPETIRKLDKNGDGTVTARETFARVRNKKKKKP